MYFIKQEQTFAPVILEMTTKEDLGLVLSALKAYKSELKLRSYYYCNTDIPEQEKVTALISDLEKCRGA